MRFDYVPESKCVNVCVNYMARRELFLLSSGAPRDNYPPASESSQASRDGLPHDGKNLSLIATDFHMPQEIVHICFVAKVLSMLRIVETSGGREEYCSGLAHQCHLSSRRYNTPCGVTFIG